MSTPSPDPNVYASLRIARQIDERCDQFEEQWKKGPPPRIEDFLTDLSGSTRLRLLEELLLLDVFFRIRAGEAPVADQPHD